MSAYTPSDCSQAGPAPDWLASLKSTPRDSSWLTQHEGNLLDSIQCGLNTPHLFHAAVELLLLVFPFFALVRGRARLWWPLLLDALTGAQELRDLPMQIQILTRLGDSYNHFGQQAAAQNAFTLAIQHAHQKRTDDMLLAAYIGLARVQTFYLNQQFNEEVLRQLATLSRTVNDRMLQATAYQMLAAGLNSIGDGAAALGYAQTALAYWRRQRDFLGQGQTAFVMAVIHRKLSRFTIAERCLQLAQEAFARTSYMRQYGLSAYEEGVHCLNQGAAEAARQWFEMSLNEFLGLDSPYDTAMARHALALAQTALKQYDAARDNLTQVIVQWEHLHNQFELASAYQALAYLEGVAGNRAAALNWIERADAECRTLPAVIQKRERLQHDIDETRREILENDFHTA